MANTASTATCQPTLMPAMRYHDADAAIAWLESALGFRQRDVYRDAANRVAHAELTFDTPNGTGMIMLGSTHADPAADQAPWYRQPADVGGITSTIYIVVPDCAPVYAMAQAANAEVLTHLRTMDYGGGGFSLRDPEGFVWGIGEYDPWAQLR